MENKTILMSSSLETFAKLRIRATGFAYSHLAKPFYFMRDPEETHNSLIRAGAHLDNRIGKALTSLAFNYQNNALEQTLLGIRFRNPVGLSAGFDKNGEALGVMEDVGFGFAEVGSITANACTGNPGVRLKRLPEMSSLWVHLGLNNIGADAIHERLKGKELAIPIGVSTAKTNCEETTKPSVGLKDYLYTVRKFRDAADYFDLNISCPNAYGGKDFADPVLFGKLAGEVDSLGLRQPVFVKLSPDLSSSNVDELIAISDEHNISGFICTNLTEKHGLGPGGLSGKALEPAANKLLSYAYKRAAGSRKGYTFVGVGGIFSAEDAYKKIKLGASLVELITGMIYKGPGVIGEINYGLVRLLERDGFSKISEATGTGYR